MQYLLLIYTPEAVEQAMSPAEQEAYMNGYFQFTRDVETAKVLVGGEALQSVATATTVRVRDNQTLITDGPFAETHEQFGGYFLLECQDIDEAVAWAAKVPTAKYGSIEIRPQWDSA